MLREKSQDLIEYVAPVAFATTAGMQAAAGGVSEVFTTIGAILTNVTSL